MAYKEKQLAIGYLVKCFKNLRLVHRNKVNEQTASTTDFPLTMYRSHKQELSSVFPGFSICGCQ